MQGRSLITINRKSVTDKNNNHNESPHTRSHLDIETHKHITEHLVNADEYEAHRSLETSTEEESDASRCV